MKKRLYGFTLIELLIVVAIIGILSAIAVPNFLNAQLRAKVARVNAELRSIRTAMEMYRMDNNQYLRREVINRNDELALLTTPIAYISFIPRDPFSDPINFKGDTSITLHAGYYVFENFDQEPGFVKGVPLYNDCWIRGAKYSVLSVGPDGREGFNNGAAYRIFPYEASNGLRSSGDIVTTGPVEPGSVY
ncbi:MAG: prepilin-type N-terminal cleavage/methylation domain-containing protein [Candidatus Omnitrophota bacterium]